MKANMPREEREELAAWQKLQAKRNEFVANRQVAKWRKMRKYKTDMWDILEGLCPRFFYFVGG
jgi:hypothetical protein